VVLINLAETLSYLDLKDSGIGVNGVSGFVETPLTAKTSSACSALITPEQAAGKS
jgi:hypothetical protein